MRHFFLSILVLGLFFVFHSAVGADQPSKSFSIEVGPVPSSGILFAAIPAVFGPNADVSLSRNGEKIDAQYVAVSGSARLIAKLPDAWTDASAQEPLSLTLTGRAASADEPEPLEKVELTLPAGKITQIANKGGGFPTSVTLASGQKIDGISFGDRLYDADTGAENRAFGGPWNLSADPNAALSIISDGPAATVVRQRARFMRGSAAPPSAPRAVYDWYYFKTPEGFVYVDMRVEQDQPHAWRERHLLELHLDDGSLPKWCGRHSGAPGGEVESGQFGGEMFRTSFRQSAALTDGVRAVELYHPDCHLYGDIPGKRIYLHAAHGESRTPWTSLASRSSAWLRFGTVSDENPPLSISPPSAFALQTVRWNYGGGDWRDIARKVEEIHGRTASDAACRDVESADLAASFFLDETDAGKTAALHSLIDKKTGFVCADKKRPVFTVRVENAADKKTFSFDSLSGWNSVSFADGEILCVGPKGNPELSGLTVRLGVAADAAKPGIRFTGSAATNSPAYRLFELEIMPLTVESSGRAMTAFYPGPSGDIIPNAAESGVRKVGSYPGLKAPMPYMAVYDETRGLGLFYAPLDPSGAAKQIRMTNETPGSLDISVLFPLPVDPKAFGAETALPGELLLRSFSGDWYDAAVIYRDWVRLNADWYPPMGPDGRRTTPDWMKRLSVWGRVFGDAKNVVPEAKEFHEFLGIPCGFHWYHWHEIPFDNDYPHYLPPKEGFGDGVRTLQALGCYVMPYTNGRLWDTRDKGNEDWQFTAVALRGACKREDGKPQTESYRSKEADGSRVVLAAMCPGSQVWKDKIADNNARIVREYGLNGVYMDQIAACGPFLCEDAEHGHPLRGGSWWAAEYKKLLQRSRTELPPETIFASECNAETCVDLIHGMVCWTFEGENVVPAFDTVYSGVVSVYGRSYDNNVSAMKAKWAQSLVFGDQLGWFPPSLLKLGDLADYFRPLARFRHHQIEFFYQGEGARPPKLLDPVPTDTQNWNIFGRKAINTVPVVQTGARRIVGYRYLDGGERDWASGKTESVLLIFTNSSDKDAQSRIAVRWDELGVDPEYATFFRTDSEGKRSPMTAEEFSRPFDFSANTTWGIVISPEK